MYLANGRICKSEQLAENILFLNEILGKHLCLAKRASGWALLTFLLILKLLNSKNALFLNAVLRRKQNIFTGSASLPSSSLLLF